MVYNAEGICVHVCVSVCMYVSNTHVYNQTFKKTLTFIFAHQVYLEGIRVKFVYEGHQVKVMVTGAKR